MRRPLRGLAERASKQAAINNLLAEEDIVDYCANPNLLFDQKIYKYFDGQDSGWYWGRVDGYDKKKKYFQISYDDGDEEDMTLKEVLEWKYRADQQQAGSGSA